MLDEQLILRTSTLVHLVRRLGWDPHTTLGTGATWYSGAARDAIDERVERELAAAGLSGPRGTDEGLRSTLEAIARPELEYFGWAGGTHGSAPEETVNLTILAGSRDGDAFVLVRNVDREFVVLISVAGDRLLDNFVAQLPTHPPARGRELVVPSRTMSARARDSYDGGGLLRTSTPDENERTADEFRRVLGLKRTGGGTLYVAGRSRTGRRERVERPLTYLDTVEGRWLAGEVPNAGDSFATLTPGTSQLLTERLRDAQSGLALD